MDENHRMSTLILTPADVEPVARTLVGAIDVDGGPTDEQVAVLRALLVHLWNRPDLEPSSLAALDPATAAEAITEPNVRWRLHELIVVLEACRHPQSAAQVGRVEEYAAAFEVYGPELQIFRDCDRRRLHAAATEDYDRFYADRLEDLSEPGLRGQYLRIDEPDLELAAQLEAFHDLADGTLGHAYIEFYRRNNITVPGKDTHTPAHYVSHDMNHVIAGYEPTGPGELALAAFTLAMRDNDANWIQFVTSLIIHEAGILQHGAIMPKAATLTRPGAADLFGDGFRRGGAVHERLQPSRRTSRWPNGRSLKCAAHYGVPEGDLLG